jgi:hypothetical protein
MFVSIHGTRATSARVQILFITYYSSPTCFSRHHDDHEGNLQEYYESKLSVKMCQLQRMPQTLCTVTEYQIIYQ